MSPTSARTVVVQNYIRNGSDLNNFNPDLLHSLFAVKDVPIPEELPADSVLLQTLYVANDIAQCALIQQYMDLSSRPDLASFLLPLGAPMMASSISRVVKLGSHAAQEGRLHVGDLVQGRTPWATFAVVKKETIQAFIPLPGVSPSHYLGFLGGSGHLAYWALNDILEPKPTSTLVISVAAGAIGSVAVQYAKKVLGVSRVVGITGSEEKCEWVKSVLGADEAVSYKSTTFVEDLKNATPDKIDCFLDIAGGKILEDVMLQMNSHGTVCLCGGVSVMGSFPSQVLTVNYMNFMMKRLNLRAYILTDYITRLEESSKALSDAVASGKVTLAGAETVIDVGDKVEELPQVWASLFAGANKGKLVTKLAE